MRLIRVMLVNDLLINCCSLNDYDPGAVESGIERERGRERE